MEVNKTPKSFRLDTELVKELRKHSIKTMIPETRILEKALEIYLKKEGKNE